MTGLDETRLADAVRAFYDARGTKSDSGGVRAAIAAWEASAPKAEPATDREIDQRLAAGGLPQHSTDAAFRAGVRWAESRQPRAEPKP